MGGSVALVVRYESGETISVVTHTNPLSVDLKRRAVLVDKDEAYMRGLIKEMLAEEDYGEVPLAPLGYGINVIDFQRNFFLTMQGHSNFRHFTDTEMMGNAVPERRLNFLQLCDAGCVVLRRIDHANTGNPCVTIAPIKDAEEGEEIAKFVAKHWRAHLDNRSLQTTYYDAKIEGATLTILEYPESKRGAAVMKRKLKTLGFAIDAAASKTWNSFHEY